MRLIAEIGSDSSQLRSDVGALPNFVKRSFGQMKSASEGGIADNVKNLKRGFNDLKDVLVGGGMVQAVSRFFTIAIDAARKSTDANDVNAAAVRRFGDALDSMKATGASVAVAVVGAFNRVGEAIGTSMKGAWAAITGTWDKFREGEAAMQSTEDAARKQALAFEEMKKHAAEFNKLNAEAKQLAEQKAASELKALSLLDQRNVLEQRLLEAERAQVDAGEDRLKRRQAEVDAMKLQNQIADVQRAMDKERIENWKKSEKEFADLQQKRQAEEIAHRKEIALDNDTQIEVERILSKSADSRTTKETEFLKLAKLLSDEKRIQVEIDDLLEKRTTEGLTPAEQTRLRTLIAQGDKLNEQISQKQALIGKASEHAASEAKVTSEYSKQIEAASTLNKIIDGFTSKLTRVGSEYSAQSTSALEGLRDRLRNEQTRAKLDVGSSTLMANGERYNPAVGFYGAELEKIEKELQMRADVNRYARTYGQDAAVRQYGDELTSRAFRDLQDTSTRTADAVGKVSEILERVFPRVR